MAQFLQTIDKQTSNDGSILGRREFFLGMSAASGVVLMPTTATANPFGIAVGRFFAGLVFNVAYAVFVRLASDHIVAQIRNGRSPRSFASLPQGTSSHAASYFVPENFQASLAIAGLVQTRISDERRIQAFLDDASPVQLSRLEGVRKYLYDNRVEAAFYTPRVEASRRISVEEPLNNILSIRYLADARDDVRNHYRTMIDGLGSDIFDPQAL